MIFGLQASSAGRRVAEGRFRKASSSPSHCQSAADHKEVNHPHPHPHLFAVPQQLALPPSSCSILHEVSSPTKDGVVWCNFYVRFSFIG